MRPYRTYYLTYIVTAICAVASLAIVSRTAQALTMSPVLMELAANPGEQVNAKFTLTNEEQDTKTLYLLARNFEAKDESGVPSFSPKKEGLASWIDMPASVTVGPRERKDVRFSIPLPGNLEPGGYFAAIFAASQPPAESGDGSIAIGSELGTLVLLNVPGSITEGTKILEFKNKSKSFYTSLPVDLYFRFQNSGQTWVKPKGDVVIHNTFGGTTKIISANPDGANVLPKSIRRFEVAWLQSGGAEVQDQNSERPPETPHGFWGKVGYEWKYFALGRYSADLTLTYNNDTGTTQTASVAFYVFPWHFLIIAIPAIIILLWLLWFFLKRYNRYIVRKAQKRR
jgi:hypothetical protein